MSGHEENCTCDSPEDSAGLHHREWCGQPVTGPAMTTRLEAAAKAMHDLSDDGQQGVPYTETRRRSRERFAGYALTAADAYDVANNVHRVRLDDATVERAARALNSDLTLQWEKMPEWVREGERRMVRAVLAAAVEAKP